MAKHSFTVAVPIAGTAYIEVEAETEEEAIRLGLDGVTLEHIETWEALEQFHEGNVCYCPHPWSAEAQDNGPVEEEAA